MQEEKVQTLNTPGVVDKYQAAGKIANQVLQRVIKKCGVGVQIVQICQYGDNQIDFELSKVYNKKHIQKGIAFPTCISINHICGHFSPYLEIQSKCFIFLSRDLGVHIDGYAGLAAHTIVIKSNPNEKTQGKKADVILACYKALQGAIRLMKPGSSNSQITKLINEISKDYNVNPVEGVLSHQMKKHLIDGNNVIINKQTYQQKVYSLDIMMSTGEGKPKQVETRITVYKRAIDKNYMLKTKHGRSFFNQLLTKYPSFAFSALSFEDEITTKLGIKQCLQHELLHPYPVLGEKEGQFVSQFKATVLVLLGSTVVVSGLNIKQQDFNSQFNVTSQYNKKLIQYPMDKSSQRTLRKQGVK